MPAPPSAEARAQPATKITVAGYVETYYQLNFRAPSNGITNLRGFDNRDRAFTLSNVALDGKGERGPVTARVTLQVGATPSTYYLGEPTLPGANGANATGPEIWKYLQQANLAYSWGTTVVDAGLFPSPIGRTTATRTATANQNTSARDTTARVRSYGKYKRFDMLLENVK